VHDVFDCWLLVAAFAQEIGHPLQVGDGVKVARRLFLAETAVDPSIAQIDLVYERVRLYQDGLPACGKEERIVRDLAQAGSLNHQLLLELMGRGALLTGTESAELLIEEYNLARQALVGGKRPRSHGAQLQALSRQLLARRDRIIADRIAHTLEPGGTGLVFLGLMHSLDGLMPADIQVTRWEPNLRAPRTGAPTAGKKEQPG
jgi:hypothetical protein